MLNIAIICFVIAALFGAYLLSYVLTDKNTPKGVALIHGIFAATGIVTLIFYAMNNPMTLISVAIFVLAALGGFLILFIDLTGKKIPKALAIGHGLLAATGLIVLIALTYQSL